MWTQCPAHSLSLGISPHDDYSNAQMCTQGRSKRLEEIRPHLAPGTTKGSVLCTWGTGMMRILQDLTEKRASPNQTRSRCNPTVVVYDQRGSGTSSLASFNISHWHQEDQCFRGCTFSSGSSHVFCIWGKRPEERRS